MTWAKIVEWICQDWVQEVAKALLYGIVGADIVLLINDWKRFKAEETEENKEGVNNDNGNV